MACRPWGVAMVMQSALRVHDEMDRGDRNTTKLQSHLHTCSQGIMGKGSGEEWDDKIPGETYPDVVESQPKKSQKEKSKNLASGRHVRNVSELFLLIRGRIISSLHVATVTRKKKLDLHCAYASDSSWLMRVSCEVQIRVSLWCFPGIPHTLILPRKRAVDLQQVEAATPHHATPRLRNGGDRAEHGATSRVTPKQHPWATVVWRPSSGQVAAVVHCSPRTFFG
uniref:Uncharacterized protein n=1 Tax=Knipowitschia caucasica TaxID=637954 RepID=A0AAV2LKH6_KNICA